MYYVVQPNKLEIMKKTCKVEELVALRKYYQMMRLENADQKNIDRIKQIDNKLDEIAVNLLK